MTIKPFLDFLKVERSGFMLLKFHMKNKELRDKTNQSQLNILEKVFLFPREVKTRDSNIKINRSLSQLRSAG